VFIIAAAARTASAQPADAAAGRVSLNVGVSSVRAPGGFDVATDAALWVGADLSISRRWSLRAEIGRRWPSRRIAVYHADYYTATVPEKAVDGVTVVETTSLFDLAILMRARWPVRRRFEIAALLGPDMRFVRSHSTLTIPRNPAGEGDPDVTEQLRQRHVLDVFDVGLELGTRLNEHVMLQVYGLAGFTPPPAEEGRSQQRAGAAVRYRF
jgi:hypothetical protein